VKVPRQNPIAPSVHLLWPIAEWQEREVYDLFGVKYAGHPDLRRLFLEDDWKGFPLLKDYKDDFTLERPW
jgi:NADH:ubiquinone oxidoreductase subunit C